MSKRRRFFIFFASAALMTLFLWFSRSMRDTQGNEDPRRDLSTWWPNSRVLIDVLSFTIRSGESVTVLPKPMNFPDSTLAKMKELKVSKLELRHNIDEGDVEFSHPRTIKDKKPKRYYIIEPINDVEYFLLVEIEERETTLIDFGKHIEID